MRWERYQTATHLLPDKLIVTAGGRGLEVIDHFQGFLMFVVDDFMAHIYVAQRHKGLPSNHIGQHFFSLRTQPQTYDFLQQPVSTAMSTQVAIESCCSG